MLIRINLTNAVTVAIDTRYECPACDAGLSLNPPTGEPTAARGTIADAGTWGLTIPHRERDI